MVRIAIANHLLEVFEAGGVDHGEPAVLEPCLISTGAEQLLNFGIRKFLAARSDKRIADFEPVHTRSDDLELRRNAFDFARPFLHLRGEGDLPIALELRVIDGEEPDDFGLAIEHETRGIGAGESNAFEASDGGSFGGNVA